MPSGLGRGIDKSIGDLEEEFGFEDDLNVDEHPEKGESEITPEHEATFNEFVSRMDAVTITDEGGQIVIPDEKLLLDFHWWLVHNDLRCKPGPFVDVISRSWEYNLREEIMGRVKQYWHIGGPSYEIAKTGSQTYYSDPTGNGVWTKSYLEAMLPVVQRLGTHWPEGLGIMQRSIKYWSEHGENYVMPEITSPEQVDSDAK